MGWNIKPPKIVELIHKNELLKTEIGALLLDTQVTVVSFFGPSQYILGSDDGRARGFKKAFELAVDAFGSLKLVSNNVSISRDVNSTKAEFTTINGIYNEEEALVILCLDGAFDPNVFLKAFQSSPGIRFMSLWSDLKCSYSKSLLLLFSVSHLMVLCNVAPYFDTSYIGLFQALERLRHEMQPHIRDILEAIPGLPEAWLHQGRICSPRLLFFMPADNHGNTSTFTSNTVKDVGALQKLKTKLGSEIYQILRKCRIITNNSGHSLFAIPMDQDSEFIFLYDEKPSQGGDLLEYINKFCEVSNERITAGLSPRVPTEEKVTHRDYVRKFRTFLLTHIKVAQAGGFDDNAHRVAAEDRKYTFILPKLKDWINVFTKLGNLLLGDLPSDDKYASGVLRKFAQFDTDAEYLENQCNYNFHKVFSIYSKNLPAHYSHEEQTRRVNAAIDSFLKISTAPGIVPWLEKLTEKCERFWKRGRQQCAVRSLHRKLCINPCHQIEPGDHLEVLPAVIQDESLPKMKHSTGNRLTSYCNCGRRSGFRDEPFTIRAANFDFYERLALDCCHKLESYKFPVFEDTLADGKGEGLTLEEMLRIFLEKKDPAILQEDDDRPISLERDLRQEEDDEDDVGGDFDFQDDRDRDDFIANLVDTEEQETGDLTRGVEDLELNDSDDISGMGLSQEQIPKSLPLVPLPETPVEPSPPPADDHPSDLNLNYECRREYLPGMLHSRCPDLLPLFPSWSLVRFGISSVYAHNIGILYQPDFLVGSAFLLPYDVRVKAPPGVSKPIPRRIMGKLPGKTVKRFEDVFNVKIFIGFEYECRKGHRFMLESTDKVLNISNPNFGPSIRQAAIKAATSDMPLYFKCPCNTHSTGEQLFAQLMRLHVITPKAPVHVQLNPRVQPALNSPYFFPGKEPIKLSPSIYWILRLPFSYVSEDQIFSPPTAEDAFKGRICRGLFDVVSMTQSETLAWESATNQ